MINFQCGKVLTLIGINRMENRGLKFIANAFYMEQQIIQIELKRRLDSLLDEYISTKKLPRKTKKTKAI